MKKQLLIASGAMLGITSVLIKRKLQWANLTVDASRILVLGDSVAFGYQTDGGMSKFLEKEFEGAVVSNKGINGLTSSGLFEKIREGTFDDDIRTATVVLLNIGGNDLLDAYKVGGAKEVVRQFPKKRAIYRRNMRKIYTMIRSLNPEVRIVQNSLYNSLEEEFRYYGFTDVLFAVWNQAIGGKEIIKVNTSPIGKNREIWLDMVHPTEEGYRLMTELVSERLKPFVRAREV